MPSFLAGMSGAAADLGLGNMLAGQVEDETDEQRKKRMQQMEMSRMMGPQQSLAVHTLFGQEGYSGARY